MCLTRFYNTYGLAKVAAMAGIPWCKAMRHYVVKETELLEQITSRVMKNVQTKLFNRNDASETQCCKCNPH